MRLEFWLLLLFVALGTLPQPPPRILSSVPPSAPPAIHPPAPPKESATFTIKEYHVFLIVIDGLRPDALARARTPNIDRLWQSGLYTWNAQTILPSLTLPAMASLLSGLPPERHEILWNYWDPQRGRIAVPTIFDLAQQARIPTAAFVGKQKLEHLFQPETPLHILNSDARQIIEAAIAYFSKHRPQLLLIHLADADNAGHRYGWMTVKQLQAIERVDEAIGLLLKTLEELNILKDSVIIITADHGGHGRIHGTDDPRDLTIPWILWTPEIEIGRELAQLVRIYDTAATVLVALDLAIPAEWEGVPVLEAFPAVVPGLSPP